MKNDGSDHGSSHSDDRGSPHRRGEAASGMVESPENQQQGHAREQAFRAGEWPNPAFDPSLEAAGSGGSSRAYSEYPRKGVKRPFQAVFDLSDSDEEEEPFDLYSTLTKAGYDDKGCISLCTALASYLRAQIKHRK